jgi:CcmD family protein
MGTFAIAYLIVWLAILLYVARLEYHQRHLVRTINASRPQRKSAQSRAETVSKAA